MSAHLPQKVSAMSITEAMRTYPLGTTAFGGRVIGVGVSNVFDDRAGAVVEVMLPDAPLPSQCTVRRIPV